MRGTSACYRWLLVLLLAGMVYSSIESCTANALRDVADSIDDQPPTPGQLLDDLWTSGSDQGDDGDDWWDDLWD